jgi:hypothetical protein
MIIDIELTEKQTTAWDYLTDEVTTEIGYGGGARGGKSWLGAEYINFMCIAYPKTRWAIGRRELKNLKRTTLLTLFKVYAKNGQKKDVDFNYNEQQSKITYPNGSEIYLLDLAYQPSDPLFTWMGGLELTGAWVDESNEIKSEAISILKSRVGNCNNDTYSIKPLLLETFNPSKGHIYTRYYKPYKEGKQLEYRKFVPALATDNPHIPQSYIEELKRAPKITRERLLYGNFDYDDDPTKIFEYDAIQNMFSNTFVKGTGERYITADIGGKGKDKTVVFVWDGWRVIHIYIETSTDIKKLDEKIEEIAKRFKVPRSRELEDYTGVGQGLVDNRESVPFEAGSGPITQEDSIFSQYNPKPNYRNLRSQCWIYFSEKVNNNEVYVSLDSVEYQKGVDAEEIKDMIIEELDAVKEIVEGGETKRQIISKGGSNDTGNKPTMRQLLGRSPDFGDGLMMRSYFDLIQTEVEIEGTEYL